LEGSGFQRGEKTINVAMNSSQSFTRDRQSFLTTTNSQVMNTHSSQHPWEFDRWPRRCDSFLFSLEQWDGFSNFCNESLGSDWLTEFLVRDGRRRGRGRRCMHTEQRTGGPRALGGQMFGFACLPEFLVQVSRYKKHPSRRLTCCRTQLPHLDVAGSCGLFVSAKYISSRYIFQIICILRWKLLHTFI